MYVVYVCMDMYFRIYVFLKNHILSFYVCLLRHIPPAQPRDHNNHRNNGGTISGSLDERAFSYILHNGAISAPFYSQVKTLTPTTFQALLIAALEQPLSRTKRFSQPPFPAVSKQEAELTESHRSNSITIHKGDFS